MTQNDTSISSKGQEWIRRANNRLIGRTEFRDVTLEIGSGILSRILQIRTLRYLRNDIAQTVFCVMEPWALSNINYVVTEHCGRIVPFTIRLYLPYVLVTLRTLAPDKRREGLLGSDFSYDDMRTWLYEEGHEYHLLDDENDGGPEVRIRGVCREHANLLRSGTSPFDIWLNRQTCFVDAIQVWSPNGERIVREYRASAVAVIDGILIAGCMTMTDLVTNHSTQIILRRAWYDRPIDTRVFEDSFRKQTKDYLAAL